MNENTLTKNELELLIQIYLMQAERFYFRSSVQEELGWTDDTFTNTRILLVNAGFLEKDTLGITTNGKKICRKIERDHLLSAHTKISLPS